MFSPKKVTTRRKDAQQKGIIIEPEERKIEIFKENLHFEVYPTVYYHDEKTCNLSIAGHVYLYVKFEEFSKPSKEIEIKNVEFNVLNPKNFTLPKDFEKVIFTYVADFITFKKYYYYSFGDNVVNYRKMLLKNKQQFLRLLNVD